MQGQHKQAGNDIQNHITKLILNLEAAGDTLDFHRKPTDAPNYDSRTMKFTLNRQQKSIPDHKEVEEKGLITKLTLKVAGETRNYDLRPTDTHGAHLQPVPLPAP